MDTKSQEVADFTSQFLDRQRDRMARTAGGAP
jgi:hypothetical protein